MQEPAPSNDSKVRNPLTLVLILSGAFFALFLAVSGVLYLVRGAPHESSGSKSALFGGGSVGVIELNGVIMDSKKFLKTLKHFEDNDQVKALVVRLNSPGGSVAPSQEIYEAIKNFPKPVVASMASVAASGAYYVACGTKKIFANAGTLTGSIGVIMEFANLSKLYEWAKIKRFVIKTGHFKDSGSEFRDMEPDERALLQTMIDDVLSQFKKAVSVGRHLTLDQVTKVADGRIFSGQQAKAVGLVDELGTLDEAIAAAGKLANIKGKPHVITSEKHKRRLLDMLLENADREDESSEEGRAPGAGIGAIVRELIGSTESRASLATLEPGVYWLWTGGR